MTGKLNLYVAYCSEPTGTSISAPFGTVKHSRRDYIIHSVGESEEEIRRNLNLPKSHYIKSIQQVKIEGYKFIINRLEQLADKVNS